MAGKKSEKPAASLLEAVQAGDLQRLQELIKAGGDVDETNEYSPLSQAADMGRVDMVDALLKAGADVNFGGIWVPLCCAARSKNVATLKRLLEAKPKIKVDAQEEEGATALMYAAAVGSLEMVKLLVAAGASPKKKDEDGETAIIYGKDSPAIFEFLKPLSTKTDVSYLEKEAAKPDEATEGFLAAVKTGDVSCVKTMMEKGVKLGALGKNGESALHLAVEEENDGVIELLLQAGASPNVKNQYGRTPLYRAVKQRNIARVERLIQAGANVNVKDKMGGETPFLSSISNVEGSPEVMRLLAKHGADVLAIDDYGRSALNIASRWLGNKDYYSEKERQIADGLRQAFKDVGILHPDSAQFTAAAAAGDLAAVKKLIEAGVPVNAVDEEERTVLYMAVSRRHPELVAFLLKAGADVHRSAGIDSEEDKRWGGTDWPCPKCGHGFTSLTETWHCPKCSNRFNAQEVFGEDGSHELYMTWSNGHLPLVTAARLGDSQIISLLLDTGADPNRGYEKITPLMYSCYFGHLEAARTLIARGADPKLEGKTPDRVADKISPVILAAKRGHIEVVKLLWDAGVPDKDKNFTLLVDAAKRNDAETIKRLLTEGADANAMDPLTGEKPLDVAAKAANLEAVTALIAGGANLNPTARDFPPVWQTLSGLERISMRKALSPDVVGRYLATMKVLLQAGAKPDVSIFGQSPVSIAERYKCAPMVELLKAAAEKATGQKP